MRAAAIALLVLLASEPRAEIPAHYVDRTPAQAARDAFDTEYGGVLVTELGRILRESADRECRRARALDDATLEARGRELLVRNGERYLAILTGLIEAAKFEAAMTSRAGANARADYAALRKDPDIRKYLELADPGKLARLADQIAQAIDSSRHSAPAARR